VEHDGFQLVVDLGYATLPALLSHVPAREVDAVLVSHGHPDHCADLNPDRRRGRHFIAIPAPASVWNLAKTHCSPKPSGKPAVEGAIASLRISFSATPAACLAGPREETARRAAASYIQNLAAAYCQGTVLRTEIEARAPGKLDAATDAAARPQSRRGMAAGQWPRRSRRM
jgi:hypothetical protein